MAAAMGGSVVLSVDSALVSGYGEGVKGVSMTSLYLTMLALKCQDSYIAGLLHGAGGTAIFIAVGCGLGICARWAIRRYLA